MSGATRERFEKWKTTSRNLNPMCGCEERGERSFTCSYHEGAEDAYGAATADMDELLGALAKYGDCLDSCASRTILKKVPCDCGFEAVLARYGKS